MLIPKANNKSFFIALFLHGYGKFPKATFFLQRLFLLILEKFIIDFNRIDETGKGDGERKGKAGKEKRK